MKINNEIIYSTEMQNVYNLLQDEESRFIYKQYVKLYLDDSNNFYSSTRIELLLGVVRFAMERHLLGIEKPVIDNSFIQCIFDYKNKKYKRLYLFGAGKVGETLAKVLLCYGVDIAGFIDNDIAKQSKVLFGKKIISLNEFVDKFADSAVVASTVHVGEINAYLTEVRVANNGLTQIYDAYALYEEIYYGPAFVHPVNDGIFIDAGCWGRTIHSYIDWCVKNDVNYGKIIDFEASPQFFKCVTSETAHLKNVTILPYAAYSCEKTMKFKMNRGMIQFETFNIESMPTEEIQTKKIDDIADGYVSFIKMDIEGAEYEALKGAAVTIKKYKPTLAISIYHSIKDIIEIPKFLSELVPEYCFYLRHHSAHIFETVLYAVVERNEKS
jgi:FkbM family methyltransferase